MRCAVLGSPVAHSLSPVVHRAAYRELGLDWTYDAVDVPEGTLATFLGALGEDVRGFSVTAPIKREAAQAAHQRSEHVEILDVANTLVIEDGLLSAHNTDVTGAISALGAQGLTGLRSVRIVGGGATATSMAYAMTLLGVGHIELLVRDPSRAREAAMIATTRDVDVTVRRLEEPVIEKVDLVISTVPGEAIGSRAPELVGASRAVFDVTYDPWPGVLALAAEAEHLPFVSGLDLLVHQAAFQVELMTGSFVHPQVLLAAVLSAVRAR